MNRHRTHDDVLNAIAEAIDIPDHLDQVARDRYRSLGDWLDRDESSIKGLKPLVKPQGSFLLGTVVKPWSDEEQYDIDLVCTLQTSKYDLSMRDLKQAVGTEIKGYATKHQMKKTPQDKRRCWELEYADEARFHIDILPALPDSDDFRQTLIERGYGGVARDEALVAGAIAITDKTHPKYESVTPDWPVSNPEGYALWFRSRQADALRIAKEERLRKDTVYASVDDVPDYEVKTPLQRAIQLLKRHRDGMFAANAEHKPISIIITTLGAHAYDGEQSIAQALRTVLRDMDKHIHVQGGVPWVANPSNPEENFADKWSEVPEKEANFYAWLDRAGQDFGAYISEGRLNQLPPQLESAFGKRVMDQVRLNAGMSAPALVGTAVAAAEVADVKDAGSATKPWLPHQPID